MIHIKDTLFKLSTRRRGVGVAMVRSEEISGDGRTRDPQTSAPTLDPKATIMKDIKALLTASNGIEEGRTPAMRMLGEVIKFWETEESATPKSSGLEATLTKM